MQKFLLVLILLTAFVATVFCQTTRIWDIQYTTDPSGDSPLADSVVTVEGIISGESWAFGSTYYVQDSISAWSGIMVYDANHKNAYGDSVRITATVSEYSGMTQLSTVTAYELLGTGKQVEPILVSTGEIGTGGLNAEAFEGVLVQVRDAEIVNPDLGYGEWSIDDGSGACRVDDAADYFFIPSQHDSVKILTGLLNYAYGDTKIEPRLAMDVRESGEITRIQFIQQVRYSDLIKAFDDELSDTSYVRGDTFTISGVVTMPTGLSDAGDGVKYILGEQEGGPWSAILSYDADSSTFPVLYEGDSVITTGYISEYQTGPSNMTEFFTIGEISIAGIGVPEPPLSFIKTGDLHLPVTAEQWGNVMVYAKNAVVSSHDVPFDELFLVNDGTGDMVVDRDSDSLITYYNTHPLPPVGTLVDSIRGWIYHHYGSYEDSTAYVLAPLYIGDINLGAGPPLISNESRDIVVPSSSDAVTVSADIVTNLIVSETALYYKVDSGDYTKVVMSNTGGTTWEGEIPAQPAGSFVSYFMVCMDELNQTTLSPSDTSQLNYSYPVLDGNPTIKDVQWTPWSLADTPFEGYKTTLTGVVVADTGANNNYEAYSIQDAEEPWNGVFLFGISQLLDRGDEVTVTGTMTDYNTDYHFKWDHNTVMLVDEVTVNSSGNYINSIHVSTGVLATDTSTAEQYEGVLVDISGATLMSVNQYDVTFDDGSGPCLVDGDFIIDGDDDPNDKFYVNQDNYLVVYGDTIRPGEIVNHIRGVFTWSFGSFKISVRDKNDWGTAVGIDENFEQIPLSYKLEQNFPNPFNPTTNIYFEIPQAQDVKVIVYNLLGQKVKTLVNRYYPAGHHVVFWDGRSEGGFTVPSGVYIYRIKAGDFIASRKMVMLK